METKRKGIITGATGYIGSNLVRYLLSQNWNIYIIAQPEFGYSNIEEFKDQINIFEYNNDANSLINYFKKVNADVVFHLAAAVITNYNPSQISTLVQSNIQFGTEVLEAMKYSKTKLIINTGSYWQNYNSDSYNPVDLYAATKEAFEKILIYYTEAHHIRAISLRLFDIYGENDKRNKILNLVINSISDDAYLDLTPGEQLLDMVHISDVCNAYLKAFELLKKDSRIINNIFGVFSGYRVSLRSMLTILEELLNFKLKINYGKRSYKEREVMVPCNVYEKLPNWNTQITLVEGLKIIIKSKTNLLK